VARAGAYLLFGQVENGAQCPVTMTYASVPALRRAGPGARWLPKILSRDYDPRSLPVEQKRGALVGMGMTEKQGGTDVRANTTRADRCCRPSRARFGEEGEGAWRIVGHKWFFSAPQSDAHLILAQTDEGGSARPELLLRAALPARRQPQRDPRAAPEGQARQPLERLVGGRVLRRRRLAGRHAGRGIPTILEMGSHTRLDCVVGTPASCAPR
jgi:putative acyl-CoA dehydrogenase